MENGAANVSQPGKIAFLGYMEFDSGASYRGAILITDDRNCSHRLTKSHVGFVFRGISRCSGDVRVSNLPDCVLAMQVGYAAHVVCIPMRVNKYVYGIASPKYSLGVSQYIILFFVGKIAVHHNTCAIGIQQDSHAAATDVQNMNIHLLVSPD